MRRPRAFRVAVAVLASFAVAAVRAASPSSDEQKALKLLVKAFDRVSPRNVVAVMRMSLDDPRHRQTVHVQIAKDGRQRLEVIEPLQESGIVIIEHDGIRETYIPDKKTLSLGRSLAGGLFLPSERLKLVRRNYRVHMVRNVRMAQRTIVRLDATSRYPAVGGASIYIDPASFFVMGVDTLAGAKRTRKFETVTVEYPDALPDGTFSLNVGAATTTIRESDPRPVANTAEAARHAGFQPAAPRNLPYGFVVRKVYCRSGNDYTTISFDVSDGLAAATIFEFDLHLLPKKVREEIWADRQRRSADYLEAGPILLRVVSDLGPTARRKLLEAFKPLHAVSLQEAEKAFMDGPCPTLRLGPGTNLPPERVTSIRSSWRGRLQFG